MTCQRPWQSQGWTSGLADSQILPRHVLSSLLAHGKISQHILKVAHQAERAARAMESDTTVN